MIYRLSILTSLFDDDASKLLRTLDDAIESGIIQAEVPAVFCDKREGEKPKIDERIRKVRELKYLNNLVFLSPKDVDTELYRKARKAGSESQLMQHFRRIYDQAVMDVLPKADSYLNIGYMRIMTKLLFNALTIVNLHPAIPNIGPIGMWPKVMEEQAQRPLQYLVNLDNQVLDSYISDVMRISRNKAGGMLHIVTEKPDRGPVISWYEFSLDSPRLFGLWNCVIENTKQHGIKEVKKRQSFEELKQEIRREQLKGEHPLLLLTYKNLTSGDWMIKDKNLYIQDKIQPNGFCLNREIGEYLRSSGIETLIR